MAAIAVIHILDAVGTYESTRWIFWAYIAVIAASVIAASVIVLSATRLGLQRARRTPV